MFTLYLALDRSGLCVLRLPNLVHELLVKPKVGEAGGRLGWHGPGHLQERRGDGRVEVRLHATEEEEEEEWKEQAMDEDRCTHEPLKPSPARG